MVKGIDLIGIFNLPIDKWRCEFRAFIKNGGLQDKICYKNGDSLKNIYKILHDKGRTKSKIE